MTGSTSGSGYLEAENDLERTYKVSQEQLRASVGLASACKIFDLKFDERDGPYTLCYSRNGKYLLIGGRGAGHVASFDWKSGKLLSEIQLPQETIYSVCWLHNETMHAVAQTRYSYIYDSSGVEVHALRKHANAQFLEFLPYHMLLVSCGSSGILRYQDVSTGVIINEMRTKLGPTQCMAQNPHNAIIHLGHTNGTVTFWSPNCGTPLVKMLCHRGPLTAIAVDQSGKYMATSGTDGQIKIWNLETFKLINSYFSRATPVSLSFSQRRFLAVGAGAHVTIWKDICQTEKQKSPYMSHKLTGATVQMVRFCPFEDSLGVGHSLGISSILVPGAGEAAFDSLEANPFESKKQRREAEVKHILEKIQPDMISLDTSYIGKIEDDQSVILEWNRHVAASANNVDSLGKHRSKSSTLRRRLKKQENVIDSSKVALRQKLEEQRRQREARKAALPPKRWSPLDRLAPKNL